MIKNLRDRLWLLLLCLVSIPGFAIDFKYEHDGVTLTYTVLDTGARTVETKAGTTYSSPGNKVSGNVIIPSTVYYNDEAYTVIKIGEYAFPSCTGLTSIELPESLTSIGRTAFGHCTGLTSIQLPESINSIGNSTFWACTGLSSIELPDNITSIEAAMFSGCTGLTSIRLPESITSIGESAFYNCTGLTLTQLTESITSIGNSAFENCTGLTSIELPESLTSIGRNAFGRCTGLTSIELPESLTSIGDYVFSGCTGLTSIELPESLTSIGDYAFNGCTSLTSIQLPESITSIGNSTFYNCSGLKNITIPSSLKSIGSSAFKNTALECIILDSSREFSVFKEFGIKKVALLCDNPYIDTMFPESAHILRFNQNRDAVLENGLLFNSDKSTLLFAFLINGALTLPPVGTIADYAFEYCSGITELNIVNPLSYVGDNAFANCNSNLVINASISPAPMISESSFEGLYDSATLNVPEEIIGSYINPHNSWSHFKNLTVSSQYPSAESFTSGGLSFRLIDGRYAEVVADKSYKGLTSVTIPEEVPAPDSPDTQVPVTGIAPRAFAGCESLTQVNIPETVTTIRDAAFLGCSSLADISIPASVTVIGSSVFVGTALTSIDLPSVVSVGEYAFDGMSTLTSAKMDKATSLGACSFRGTAVTRLDLPSVVTLGDHALDGMSALAAVSLDKATSIGAYSFRGTAVTQLDLPSVEKICDYAFDGMSTLAAVSLDKATLIGVYSFRGTAVTQLDLPSVEKICDYAFDGVSELKSLQLGESIESIGSYAFRGTAIPTLNITSGKSMTIGTGAFQGNDVLTAVTLGDGVVEAGDYSFADCKKLVTLTASGDLKKIGRRAFNCTNGGITTLTIPKDGSLTEIADSAFMGIRVRGELSLPDALKKIGNEAFANARLITKITMPANEKLTVGNRAFVRVQRLAEVDFPVTITSLGDSCFADNIITSLNLRANNIGDYAFCLSKNLQSIQITGNGEIGANAFNALPSLETALLDIPTIGNNAFYESPKLHSVTLSDNVKVIGESAFKNSVALANVNFGLGLEAIHKAAFMATALDTLSIPSGPNVNPVIEIGESAFADCSLFYLSLGNRVKSIASKAFKIYRTDVWSGNTRTYKGGVCDLGNSIESLDDEAIVGSITKLIIPASLKKLGRCNNLSADSLIMETSSLPLEITGLAADTYFEDRFKYLIVRYVFINRPIVNTTGPFIYFTAVIQY